MEFLVELDVSPGVFYNVSGGFFLPIKDIKFRSKVTIGNLLPLSCMLNIYLALVDNERVGFYFTTRFTVVNGGGYLLTYLQGKRPAEVVDVLIKNEDLVVYNYPNRGTLVISPKVSDEIETIFQEQ